MEPANIRDVVQRLKKRGLVRTEHDKIDGRLMLLSLTSAGIALVEKVLPLSRQSTAAILAPLSLSERQVLLKLLQKRTCYT